jgi:O-succinylbenzoic acid--CoA ligase
MIVDLLDEAAGDAERVALVSEERSWTYGELGEAVSVRAELLRAEGAVAGRVVPISMDATADAVVMLLAVWRTGATAAPLSSRLTPRERDRAGLAGESSQAQAVLWTSGTGGRPRGVAISYRNLAASARGAEERLQLEPDDVWLASLSPAHIGGLALITRALLLGNTLVAVGPVDAPRTATLIEGRGLPAHADAPVTHVSLVPTQLLRLLDAAADAAPPETFRCALIGGAHTPTGLVRRALDAGWPLALTYGLTEATSQVATSPPGLVRSKPGSVGRPLDGVDVRIADDGEILVRGATVAQAYVGAETPHVVDPDGWLHTGDLGRIDQDGDLWVTGRRSDRIVTGGVTVDAVEVEEALRAHPGVGDACVVGVPDAEWGERVAAWVEPTGSGVDVEAVRAFLEERLGEPKLPRVYHVAPGLPRNANGKVDRAAVRQKVGATLPENHVG